jgi:hypothetical protein
MAVVALLLAMLLKGLWFLCHDPFYAYANNYDQVRTMSQFGIVADDPRYPLGTASFAAPLIKFHMEQRRDPTFYRSSDHRLVQATISAARWFGGEANSREEVRIDVRWKGIISFLLLVAGIGFGAWCLLAVVETERAAVALAAAGVALTDPFNLMYASTWYLEFGALVYGVIGVAGLYIALVRSPQWPTGAYWAWAVVLLFGASKYQYAFFPIGLAALMAIVWHRRFTRRFLVFAIVSGLLIPLYLSRTSDHPNNVQIAGANNSNALFNVFLQLPSDPAEALRLAGLPEACGQFIGTTWFRPDGNDAKIVRDCPEIADVGQGRKLLLAAANPAAFLGALFHAAELSQTWIDPFVGHIGGRQWGKLSEERSVAAVSLASWIAMLPASVYALAYLSMLAAATCLGGFLARRADGRHLWATAYGLCGAVGSYAFICAFFGEGFNDVQKHAHMSFSAIAIIALLSAAQCAACVGSWLRARAGSGASPLYAER